MIFPLMYVVGMSAYMFTERSEDRERTIGIVPDLKRKHRARAIDSDSDSDDDSKRDPIITHVTNQQSQGQVEKEIQAEQKGEEEEEEEQALAQQAQQAQELLRKQAHELAQQAQEHQSQVQVTGAATKKADAEAQTDAQEPKPDAETATGGGQFTICVGGECDITKEVAWNNNTVIVDPAGTILTGGGIGGASKYIYDFLTGDGSGIVEANIRDSIKQKMKEDKNLKTIPDKLDKNDLKNTNDFIEEAKGPVVVHVEYSNKDETGSVHVIHAFGPVLNKLDDENVLEPMYKRIFDIFEGIHKGNNNARLRLLAISSGIFAPNDDASKNAYAKLRQSILDLHGEKPELLNSVDLYLRPRSEKKDSDEKNIKGIVEDLQKEIKDIKVDQKIKI